MSASFTCTADEQNFNSNCWYRSSVKYNLDPWLLYSIAYVESGHNIFAINKNKNGSYDMGMMQINSIWIPELKKVGIEPKHLFDPCTSIDVGAWILAQNIKKYGYSKSAIGAYNSRTPSIGLKYADKVLKAYARFTGRITPKIGYKKPTKYNKAYAALNPTISENNIIR